MDDLSERRRSGRQVKLPQRYTDESNDTKRKRARTEESDDEDVDESDSEDDKDDDSDDDHVEVAQPKRAARQNAEKKDGKSSAPKRSRAANKKAPKRVRKVNDATEGETSKGPRASKVKSDILLFSSILSNESDVESVVEKFLESLEASPNVAMAELINSFLRACGCDDSVDEEQVVDYDDIEDRLEDFSDSLRTDNSPVYPLTSKLAKYKTFRRCFSGFLQQLVFAAAESEILYNSDLMHIIQAWVTAMSSSQIRSFRHTATFIALEIETGLAQVADLTREEAEEGTRQIELEKKRQTKMAQAKGPNATRLQESAGKRKDLEDKLKNIETRKKKTAEFIRQLIDGVFKHRYRDYDASIRVECVKSLGSWINTFPSHFIDVEFLRYLGWMLSDVTNPVRLEAVKSLLFVYKHPEQNPRFTNFTDRFLERFLEIARYDTELSIRVAVIHVLIEVDKLGLMEDSDRETLCLLVFSNEARVRRAVAPLIKSVWDESVTNSNAVTDQDNAYAGIKIFCEHLIEWSQKMGESLVSSEQDMGHTKEGGPVLAVEQLDVLSKSRVMLIVESLWTDIPVLRDWDVILKLLLIDHTAEDQEEEIAPTRSSPQRRALNSANGSSADKQWRLDEDEEHLALKILVSCLRKLQTDSANTTKKGDSPSLADITLAMIRVLPKLFRKYQSSPTQSGELLYIPLYIDLDMYHERQIDKAYENLWDDIVKLFLTQTKSETLVLSMQVVAALMATESLTVVNSSKIVEMEDALSSSLREAIANKPEIDTVNFARDEVQKLEVVCARLDAFASSRDISTWMDENTRWNVLLALASRGKFAHEDEQELVQHALHVLTMHVAWKSKRVASDEQVIQDGQALKDSLLDERDTLVETLLDYATGVNNIVTLHVQRAAFEYLLFLHMLFGPRLPTEKASPLASLVIELSDDAKSLCCAFVRSEIAIYAEKIGVEDNAPNRNWTEEYDSDADTPTPKPVQERDPITFSNTQQFVGLIAKFIGAVNTTAFEISYGTIVLPFYGLLGPAYDAVCSEYIKIVRHEGIYRNQGDIVVQIVTESIQDAFDMILDGSVAGDDHVLALAKDLSNCFMIRGTHFSVVKKLDPKYLVEVQSTLLSWIFKRLSTLASEEKKHSLKLVPLFFKTLVQLLGAIDGRHALLIKAHLEQAIAQTKVEILATDKTWEPLRAYQKKLTSIQSKDRGLQEKKTKSKPKGDTGTSDEATSGPEEEVNEDRDEGEVAGHLMNPTQSTHLSSPTNPFTGGTAGSALTAWNNRSGPSSPSKTPLGSPPKSATNKSVTPNKRARTDEEGEGDVNDDLFDEGDENEAATNSPIRRKRVRH